MHLKIIEVDRPICLGIKVADLNQVLCNDAQVKMILLP